MERHKKKRAQVHNDDKVTSNNKRTKNTSSYVQILGTGMDTQDTSPSILLFFDSHRYIFNAGEGLLRFCTEHNIKPSKIGDMFLTRVCSETASGLAGLLLTLKGIKENRQHPKDYYLTGSDAVSLGESSHLDGLRSDHGIDIWGPPDIELFVNALKSFVPHDMMRHTHIIGETKNTKLCDQAVDFEWIKDPFVLIDNELVRISATLLKPTHTTGETVVIYICELSDIPGKFDPMKAASYGVDRKFYGTLQKGEPVYISNMKILPEYVLDPSIPGPVVLIVDCPTEEHIKELVSAQFFQCYFEDTSSRTEGLKTVTCVIHMGPASVTETTEYQDWKKKFGSAQHILAGHQKKNLDIPVLRASARITSRLNYLCPQLFPAQGLSSMKNIDVTPNLSGSCEDLSIACSNNVSSENLLKFHLRPFKRQGLDYSEVPSLLNYEKIVDDLLAEKPLIANDAKLVSKFWEKNDYIHNNERCSSVNSDANLVCCSDNEKGIINDNIDIPPCLENITREDMEIVFLGTGSSQPSNYRNVSSIFVNLFSNGCLLLDCGEGTFAQMIRRFSIKGAEDAVKDLRLIWISHMHADHHAGLVRILAARAKLIKKDLVSREEPLPVIGPKQLQRYLELYSKIEDLNMSFFDSEGTTAKPNPDLIDDILKEKLHAAGLESLCSVHVEHSINDAFGVVIKGAERFNSAGKIIPGWKLVYSGDTKPCDLLKEAAFGATLLIHEATFEDMMEKDAKHKGHSTTTQAIEAGAGAYRIILTHFSQRYPKVPVINDCYMDKTCIAFDMMTVNAADLPAMPKVLPYIQNLFADDQNADGAI